MVANATFASSIYAYNSPNQFVNLLYAPGLYLSFIFYKSLGIMANNDIRKIPLEKIHFRYSSLIAFMGINLLFPMNIQKFWGKEYHSKAYENYLDESRDILTY